MLFLAAQSGLYFLGRALFRADWPALGVDPGRTGILGCARASSAFASWDGLPECRRPAALLTSSHTPFVDGIWLQVLPLSGHKLISVKDDKVAVHAEGTETRVQNYVAAALLGLTSFLAHEHRDPAFASCHGQRGRGACLLAPPGTDALVHRCYNPAMASSLKLARLLCKAASSRKSTSERLETIRRSFHCFVRDPSPSMARIRKMRKHA